MDARRKRSMAKRQDRERGMERERKLPEGEDSKEERKGDSTDPINVCSSDEEDKNGEPDGDATEPTHGDNGEIGLPIFPFDVDRPEINYITGQWERSEGAEDKLGKLHLQFFVEFRDKVRIPQAREYLRSISGESYKGWLEPARSTAALEYCRKDRSRLGNIYEFGVRGGRNGKNSKLNEVFSFIQNGGTVLEASTRWPDIFSRNVNAIRHWGSFYDKPRDSTKEIIVEIYWGITGSGKSYKAYSENPDAYRKMSGKYWDGYKGQDTVIVEDFRPPHPDDWKTMGESREVSIVQWLRILDKYPFQIEYKGGSCQLRATKFIFTSNFSPDNWFEGELQQSAFRRRVSRILYFPRKWKQGDKPFYVEQHFI